MTAQSWWPLAAARLFAAKHCLLALDFDGTLAPLVEDPEAARIPSATQAALHALAQAPQVSLALVSGRPAHYLARLANPPDQTLIAGSHGAEMGRLSAGRLTLQPHPLPPGAPARLALIERGLADLLVAQGSPAGAWVEHKPLAHVLHTRMVADAAAKASLTSAAQALGRALNAHVLQGKEVVELAIFPAGKAQALSQLSQQTGATVLAFIGDDYTDELALRALTPPDVAIKVGQEATAAEFSLTNPDQVSEFLSFLVNQLPLT